MKICHSSGFLLYVSGDNLTAPPLFWQPLLSLQSQSNTTRVRALNGAQNGAQVTLHRQCRADWRIRFMLLIVLVQLHVLSHIMALIMAVSTVGPPLWAKLK